MSTTEVFSLTDTPLNTSMLIEASAGTGKTYSLNHIVLRLLVEKSIPIGRILLVTFTKSATAEMAARIRSLLLDVSEALRELKDTGADYQDADSAPLYAALDENLRRQYAKWRAAGLAEDDILARLEAASASMDDAAIYTIHSFCQRMLTDFVFASQGAFETKVADDRDLILKTVDNMIRAEAAKFTHAKECEMLLDKEMGERYVEFLEKLSNMSKLTPLAERVKAVHTLPGTEPPKDAGDMPELAPGILEPEEEGYGLDEAMASFIAEAPAELDRLKAEKGVMTFANMLVDMELQVARNPEFRKAVADRYDAVLIDEFQDTDPIQFNIFRTLFLAPKTAEGRAPEEQKPLIFVGDPKQSIYAFRSADLDTYLDARDDVAKVCALQKNFRSNPGIVQSVNALFSLSKPASSFLNPRIGFEPVDFSNRGGLFEWGRDETGNPVKKPLPPFTLWKYKETVDPSLLSESGDFMKPTAQDLYSQEARLVADDIERLTSGSVFMETKHGDRPVHPSDVCVLVRKRSDAENLKKELRSRKIRYIIKIDESVLASPEARDIEVILQAVENPKDRRAMANARATNIFGESLWDIEENTEAGLAARLQIEEAGRDIETRGVLAAFKKLFVRRRVEERLLRTDRGERMLTNYDHVLELLYKASRRVKTASGMLRWLQDAIEEGSTEDDYKLRLESDADLVRIETIHTSKGLEFPIVFTLRNTYFQAGRARPKNVFEGEEDGRKWTWLNIGGPKDEKSYKPYEKAQLQENCRLLYVALTRAGCYLGVPYLMPVNKPKKGVMSFGKGGTSTTLGRVITGKFTPSESEVLDALHRLKAEVTPLGCLVKEIVPEYRKDFTKPAVSDADLHWNKDADSGLSAGNAAHVAPDWGRTSFTGMTQAIEEDKEQPALDENEDAPEEGEEAAAPAVPAPSALSPDPFRYKDRATPATAYGDFVHKLLEAVRFDEKDPAEIRKTVAAIFERMDIKSAAPAGEEDATDEELKARHIEALAVMVENVLSAKPLAPLPDFELKTLSEREKASEMDFLLSNNMAGGAHPALTARELSNALEMLDAKKYGGLHLNEKQSLTGYLSGSIDLAFAAGGKFWIIDWKTNFLSENTGDYQGQVLEEAMQKKHYKLQYLLYLVALKRHLKLRFGFEDPYGYIGGAAYLFLRGVRGGTDCGVYFDRPDAAVIDCIDKLLAEGWSKKTVEDCRKQMEEKKEGA